MMCADTDSRSNTIIFACHCLLNANAKVYGLADYPGTFPPLREYLERSSAGVIQLQCPEMIHFGPKRWWHNRSQFEIPAYQTLCKRLANEAADLASQYTNSNYTILGLLGVEGSPSCGVRETYNSDQWGGEPKSVDLTTCRATGAGIFMDAIKESFRQKKLDIPCVGISPTQHTSAADIATALKTRA